MPHLKIIMKSTIAVFVFLFICGFVAPLNAEDAPVIRVYAAASTTNAVSDICSLFSSKYGVQALTSFASSSTLAKQIENGAPADIYISANKKWMDYLADNRLIDSDTRFDLLSNRIVMIVPKDSPVLQLSIDPTTDISALLGDGWLAMGDPDHVPAGMYAKGALESLGLYEKIEKKLARTKDVRAALALVERGESPLGIVYATDAAITDRVRVIGMFPEESHPPIVYPAAVVSGNATETALKFIAFLKTSESAAIFKKYGFSVKK